jgi:hypothetical protein
MAFSSFKQFRGRIATLALGAVATALMPGCNGFELPPVPVTLPLAQNVEFSGATAVAGAVEVPLSFFCALFNEEELDAMVREAAGDLIADLVTITRVELAATVITATEGDFAPFTDSTLTLSLLELGAPPLVLGTAAANDGLGGLFSLTKVTPVDLLNDLEEGQCGIATLRLAGADLLEPGDATFDVSVELLVYAELTLE